MTSTLTRWLSRDFLSFGRKHSPNAVQSVDLQFTIVLHDDELDGGYYAEVLELPGCVSEGDTFDETMANVVDAIAEVLATRLAPQIQAPRLDDGSDVRRVSTHLAVAG